MKLLDRYKWYHLPLPLVYGRSITTRKGTQSEKCTWLSAYDKSSNLNLNPYKLTSRRVSATTGGYSKHRVVLETRHTKSRSMMAEGVPRLSTVWEFSVTGCKMACTLLLLRSLIVFYRLRLPVTSARQLFLRFKYKPSSAERKTPPPNHKVILPTFSKLRHVLCIYKPPKHYNDALLYKLCHTLNHPRW